VTQGVSQSERTALSPSRIFTTQIGPASTAATLSSSSSSPQTSNRPPEVPVIAATTHTRTGREIQLSPHVPGLSA